jgi:hypothetical protein
MNISGAPTCGLGIRLRPGVNRHVTAVRESRCCMTEEFRTVFVAGGEVHGQQVRSFLEAAGIATAVRGESLRHTHGLTLDGLGAVEILVAETDLERARSLLASADAGLFRLADEPPPADGGN